MLVWERDHLKHVLVVLVVGIVEGGIHQCYWDVFVKTLELRLDTNEIRRIELKLVLPGPVEVESVGENHLGVHSQGLFEHVLDQVVGVLSDEPVHPPQGCPWSIGEVHRNHRDLRAIVPQQLSLVIFLDGKVDLSCENDEIVASVN